MKNPLWEGVYKTFAEVPVEGPGFAGSDWLVNSAEKLSTFASKAQNENTVPPVTAYTDSLLPVVAGIVQGRNRAVRILDFGGGLGFSYYQIREALASSEGFELCVVDLPEVCEKGRQLFKDEPGITFHSSIADLDGRDFDILHIGSSLQYVEDWRAQLEGLCQLAPEYVLMANIPAGDIETYATAQNYYGSKIACWFFSVAELIATMRDNDYGLVFKSTYTTKVYGVEQPYPLDNFDAQYRIEYPCMLLFQHVPD